LTIELFKTETKTAEIKTANSSRVEPPDDSSLGLTQRPDLLL